MKTNLKFLAAVAVATVAMSQSAWAMPTIVQTQIQEFLPGPTEVATSWNTAFTFSKYTGVDPLLGVQLVLNGTSTTNLDLTNNATSTVTVNGSVGAQLNATVVGPGLNIQTVPTTPFSQSLTAGQSVSLGPLTGSDSDGTTLTVLDGASFSFFFGPGSFNVDVDATGALT